MKKLIIISILPTLLCIFKPAVVTDDRAPVGGAFKALRPMEACGSVKTHPEAVIAPKEVETE